MKDPNYQSLRLKVPHDVYQEWLKRAHKRKQSLADYLCSLVNSSTREELSSKPLAKMPVSKILDLTKPKKKTNRTDFYS